jgi:hypothetical protein
MAASGHSAMVARSSPSGEQPSFDATVNVERRRHWPVSAPRQVGADAEECARISPRVFQPSDLRCRL